MGNGRTDASRSGVAATRRRLREAAPIWPWSQQSLIAFVDLLSVIWAVVGAQLLRFGINDPTLDVLIRQTPYALVGGALAIAWVLMLGLWGTRDTRILGYGPTEYKRVATASLWLFGGVAVVSYVFQLETARGYVAIALPLGIVSLLFGRWVLRNVLVHDRMAGRRLSRVLLVGSADSVEHLNRQLSRHPEAGYRPIGAFVPGFGDLEVGGPELPLPVVGSGPSLDEILSAISATEVDTVAISGGAAIRPETLRQLGWALAAQDISMVMAPALTDIAGPRIHTQPVAGLPLIHVTTPKLEGAQGVAKRGFDLVVAGLLTAVLAVPMLVVAVLVRTDSPGSALFRQIRIGRAGDPFRMLKFRSMASDAESRLDELHAASNGNGVLFKMKRDPRVTRFGQFIRRYSIDELPQLFNVLKGDMSLVGPRPPLPVEVAGYDDFAHRRLLVKPGITGLWQVSGRSDLSWEDSMRLDLYYVENWSMIQDLMILIKTVRAVATSNGAY
ncbi:sugar transferase [Sinomonas sp. ASV486]|uniref:sugar transferase n=1 Tax=Sinomonas sp. ASV486 TaxID=3051170 RepID=UPI0027DE7916|nr:sugar transferase [Sinomonas sp. ASV486]MDQ4488831.1 sugar transferase [Sinomonas sp. ASV486]